MQARQQLPASAGAQSDAVHVETSPPPEQQGVALPLARSPDSSRCGARPGWSLTLAQPRTRCPAVTAHFPFFSSVTLHSSSRVFPGGSEMPPLPLLLSFSAWPFIVWEQCGFRPVLSKGDLRREGDCQHKVKAGPVGPEASRSWLARGLFSVAAQGTDWRRLI